MLASSKRAISRNPDRWDPKGLWIGRAGIDPVREWVYVRIYRSIFLVIVGVAKPEFIYPRGTHGPIPRPTHQFSLGTEGLRKWDTCCWYTREAGRGRDR